MGEVFLLLGQCGQPGDYGLPRLVDISESAEGRSALAGHSLDAGVSDKAFHFELPASRAARR